MKRKQTNTNTLILAALGGLVVYCLYKKKPATAEIGRINLSAYTIAENCTDISDCNAGIDDIWEAVEYRQQHKLKIPDFYMKRLAKLEAKRDKFAKAQWGMSYDEHLLKAYDSLQKTNKL